MKGYDLPKKLKKEKETYNKNMEKFNQILKNKNLLFPNAVISDFTKKELELIKKVGYMSSLEINTYFSNKK